METRTGRVFERESEISSVDAKDVQRCERRLWKGGGDSLKWVRYQTTRRISIDDGKLTYFAKTGSGCVTK